MTAKRKVSCHHEWRNGTTNMACFSQAIQHVFQAWPYSWCYCHGMFLINNTAIFYEHFTISILVSAYCIVSIEFQMLPCIISTGFVYFSTAIHCCTSHCLERYQRKSSYRMSHKRTRLNHRGSRQIHQMTRTPIQINSKTCPWHIRHSPGPTANHSSTFNRSFYAPAYCLGTIP